MFQWNDKYKWVFSDLGAGDKVGVNQSGIGIFKRHPYKGLAKEILQNVTDAKNSNLSEEIPVKARFELIYADVNDLPGHARLHEVITKCAEYYSEGDDGVKMGQIRDAADKYLSGGVPVPILKISDFNTTGLRGVQKEKKSNWSGLVRENGSTNKDNASSGAFGVGKFAPYNFTSIRTVLYSTKTIDGEYAFQGKAILTAFKEDGKYKQNIGLFADTESENFDAILTENEVPEMFKRLEAGTDIFVVGFEKESDWVEQTAISVIEYFFYSIYSGKLEVEICDGENCVFISKSNLGEMIAKFEQYCIDHMAEDTTFAFTAPTYWRLLNDDKVKIIKEPFEYNGKSMGNYELYLLTGEDIAEKRVLEMRQAGMRIREDVSFRIPINFIGMFIATGEGATSEEPEDNISSFLRKCENQAHDDWAADEYKEEKKKAKGIINRIHKIILDAAKDEMPKYEDDTINAFGMSSNLFNDEDDDDNSEEKAFTDFRPLSFETKNVRPGKKRKVADISMKKNGGSKHKKEKDKEEKKRKYQKRTDNKRGNGLGKVSEVYIYGVKTPYIASSDEYQISFVSDETVNDLMINIRLGSDDDNLSKADIASATMDGKTLALKNGMVAIDGKINKGEKKIIKIKLAERARKTLEVRGYAKR